MSANASASAGVGGGRVGGLSPSHAVSLRESAWLALLPCASALLIAIVVLGPPLGSLLFAPPATSGFWPHYIATRLVRPEPTEHARYVLALLGPLLVSGGAIVLAGRSMHSRVVAVLVPLAQATLVLTLAASVVYQARHVYDTSYSGSPSTTVYFTPATIVLAIAIALLGAVVLASQPLVARIGRATRETRTAHVVAPIVAALFVLVWLLSAFNTDATIDLANSEARSNIPFWIDEAYSVLNGRPPLVVFHAQYGQLWAYIAAGGMSLLGGSLAVYASVMLAGAAAALAAVFATFRRIAGGSWAALALFLPFVATSFFMEVGPPANRYGPANLFSLFPIRYAGPFLLLWLVVRRAQRPSPGRPVGLLVLAGLVLVNNVEFGLPAFGATLAALICVAPRVTVRFVARLAALALAGLTGAAALVAVLTLAVAGSLPHFGLLATFPRIYAIDGFGLLPMPAIGMHVLLYVTFAAAIVTATVRAAAGRRDALTGALAWAGVFGLGAGAYFAGRSHPHVLIDLFATWALALSLLLVTVVQELRRGTRWAGVAELLVMAGFGLAVCSLAQTPAPWTQLKRLSHTMPSAQRPFVATEHVVDQLTRRGEAVAILLEQGHRIAHDLGLVNVTPYANIGLMPTAPQWEQTIVALRRAHGTRLIVPREQLPGEASAWLGRAGYLPSREASGLGIVEFVAAQPGG